MTKLPILEEKNCHKNFKKVKQYIRTILQPKIGSTFVGKPTGKKKIQPPSGARKMLILSQAY